MSRDPEMMRRINANLQYVYSGQARRDAQAEAKLRKDRKVEDRIARAKQRELKKRIAELRKELEQHDEFYSQCEADDNPLGYAEGMTPAQRQGLLEEIDSAREGCLRELCDCEDQLRALGIS